MNTEERVVSWLTKCVRENPHGEIIFSDLIRECSYKPKALALMLKRLFPHARRVRKVRAGRYATLFQGIELIQTRNVIVEHVFPLHELANFIPKDVLISKSESKEKLTLITVSNLSSNGNNVLKTLVLSETHWELWVRGCKVDLSKLDIDDTFVASRENLKRVLDITQKVSLCEGLPYIKSMLRENHRYLNEKIQNGSEKARHTFRSEFCKQALPWLSRIKACLTCRRLYELKMPEGEVLDDEDDEDMSILFEKYFPNASDEMKILLSAQRDALKVKGSNGRRWNKDVISTCLSLMLRSPLAYRDLRRSKMLVLPSRRHLRRYKCTQNFIEPTKRSIPTMNKKMGKGKDKSKKSKRAKWPCGGCNNECSRDSVCCDSCDVWFHYQCLGLHGDEAELEEEEWFCPYCKCETADMHAS